MASGIRVLLPALAAITTADIGCGGGTKVGASTVPGLIEVQVSAGSPVAGALVAIYAINDATGQVNVAAGAGGVLGAGGPTDASGRITISTRAYNGPVQVIASGPSLFYADPTQPPHPTSGAPVLIQVPSSFTFSSYVTRFTSPIVPVSLYTTLADHAAIAYARGLHPSHPGQKTLTQALGARDPLFVKHITKAAEAWDPAALRVTVPASLTSGPRSLVDVAFAGLFDVGLNQLAHDTSLLARYGSVGSGLTAPLLLELLAADVDADGRLDGVGEEGKPVLLPGNNPRPIDSQFACEPLAVALAAWARGTYPDLSGISEAQLVVGRVLEALITDGSDLFGEHSLGSVDDIIDHSPPVVAWGEEPPIAVAAPAVSLAVVATDDKAGVRSVLAQVGTGAPVPATLQASGQWVVELQLQPGPNAISVWAEDGASIPNSGQFLATPYSLATTVIADSNAPAVAYNPSFASYRDERGMTVARGASGIALVPPTYAYADPVPAAIPSSGGHVYKAVSRLGWTTVPTAASLEDPFTGNPDNTPVLQFWAPYTQGVEAPIVSASYSVSLACMGCAFSDATGQLWPSPTASPGKVHFDLPLSANLIPGLERLPGPATLTATATLTDASGRSATSPPVSLTFHAVGDPLAIVEDASYPGRADPRSTHPYSISTGLYSVLFALDPTFFLPEGQVRLVRYRVSNPSPSSVALALPSLPAGWALVETWAGSSGASLGTISYAVHDITCSRAPACAGPTPIAYGGGSAGSGCGTSPPHGVTPPTESPVVTSGDLSTFAYVESDGVDLAPAPRAPTGQVIVPGAQGTAPGVIALYLGRPVAAPSRTYALPWSGTDYRYVVEDAWVKIWQGTTVCCDFDAESRRCFQWAAPSTWSGTRYFRTLASGSDLLTGAFDLVTTGTSSGTLIGEPNTVAGTVTVTRSIPH